MYRTNSKSVTTRDGVTLLPISGNMQEVVNSAQIIALVLKDIHQVVRVNSVQLLKKVGIIFIDTDIKDSQLSAVHYWKYPTLN